MLIETESNVVSSSGLKQTSSFQIASSAHAFRILSSGLYSDKIGAVLREIGCNAMDAHIAAGKPNLPFEVHLPSRLINKFYIRDFGPGLSPDEILSLYTTYFSSSKQRSNDFTGAFGLGSKSPFSYTDNFTIVNSHGGKQYTYAAYVGPEGAPTVSLMGEELAPADWQSGMMISLPVKQDDIHEFHSKAQRVFSWFRVLPKMVNSPAIKPVEYTVESAEFAIPKDTAALGVTGVSVVMGNVRYTVPSNESRYDRHTWASYLHPVLRMPIGGVDVAASRESLEFTPKTRAAIAKWMDNTSKHVGEELATQTKAFDLTTLTGMRTAHQWLSSNAGKWGLTHFAELLKAGGVDDTRLNELRQLMYGSPNVYVPKDIKATLISYYCDGRGRLRSDETKLHDNGLLNYNLPGGLNQRSAVLQLGKTKYLKDRLRNVLRSSHDLLFVFEDTDDATAADYAKKIYDLPVVKAEDLELPADWVPYKLRPKKPRKLITQDAVIKMALIDAGGGSFKVDTDYALADVTDSQKFFLRPKCAWGKWKYYFTEGNWQHDYQEGLEHLARLARHVPDMPTGIAIIGAGEVRRYRLQEKHGWKFFGAITDIFTAADVRAKVNDTQAGEVGHVYADGRCSTYDSPLLFIGSHAKAGSAFWKALLTRLPDSQLITDAGRVATGQHLVSVAKPISADDYNNVLSIIGNWSDRVAVREVKDQSSTVYPSFNSALCYDFPNRLVTANFELAADLVARLIEADERHLPSTIDLLQAA